MSAPDHWVTLIVLGRTSGWSRGRLLLVALATAVGHISLSILLGLGIVIFGLTLSGSAASYLAEGTGLIMVIAGLGYAAFALRTGRPVDYEKLAKDEARRIGGSIGSSVRYFAVLGAALSPDLSALPIFLVAVPVGLGLAVEVSVVFAFFSIATLLVLVSAGSAGLSKALARVPPKYNDALVGLTIAAVGVYLLVAG